MSEKRFELSKDKDFIFDNLKDDFLDLEDDVNMLNNLCDENEQLRFQLEECSNNKLFSRRELEKENEQLRKDCTILVQSNQEYRKENEQLRQRELYLESVLEANEILYYDGVADE